MAGRRILSKLNEAELWDYALRVLARRAYSSGEMKQKLALRAQSAADVEATMSKLREYGLADDMSFSETFAGTRLRNQGFGRIRVLHELRSKRVSSAIATKAVEKAFDGTDELQLIQNFLERKYRGKNLKQFLQEEKNLASAYRRLRNAGFSSSASITILKRYARNTDDWEAGGEG